MERFFPGHVCLGFWMCLCLNVCFFFWAWGIFCLNVVEWISCTFSVYFTSPVGSWVWSWTLWSWSFTFCLLVSIYIISHPIPILTFFLLLWVHCPCFPYAFFGFVFFHLQPFYPFSSQVSLLKFSLILLNSIISLVAFFFCIDDFLCRSCIGLIFPLSIHFQAIDQFFFTRKVWNEIFIRYFTYLRMLPFFFIVSCVFCRSLHVFGFICLFLILEIWWWWWISSTA